MLSDALMVTKRGRARAASGQETSSTTRGDTMTTLENLYHGNINPCESEKLLNNHEYKKLIELTAQAQEKFAATLTEEQKKLFDNYIMNSEELSVIINEEIFKEGYRLATQIMIECI